MSSERSEAERVAAQVSLRFFDYQLEIGSCLRPVMTNVLKIVVVAIEHLNPYVGRRLASPLYLRVSTLRDRRSGVKAEIYSPPGLVNLPRRWEGSFHEKCQGINLFVSFWL